MIKSLLIAVVPLPVARTRAEVPKIIRGLKARGFELVTVGELLGSRKA